MGGRGSSFSATGSGNEGVRQLSNDFSSNIIIDIKDSNDSITDRETDAILELKHKRNIVVYKSTDNIDEPLLDKNLLAVNDVLDTMKNDYGMSYKHLIGGDAKQRSSVKASKGRGYYAYATRDSMGRFEVYLNKNIYEKPESEKYIIEKTKKDVETGFSPKVPDDKLSVYVIVHELGHLVQFALFRKESKQKHYERKDFEKYATKMRDDVIDIAKTKYKEKNNTVCSYAAKNSAEWFAETFSSMHLNGVDSSGLTKALNDYLKGDRS